MFPLSYKLVALFCTLSFSLSTKSQHRIQIVDMEWNKPIENAIVTDRTTGKLLAITNTKGQAIIPNMIGELSISHLSYLPLCSTIKDTIFLERHIKEIPEVIISAQPADYYRLRSVVRTYQYIDSIPVNFVDAILDFYVDGEGRKLQYRSQKIDAYQNKKYIQQMKLKYGTVSASKNSIINWLTNSHIATTKSGLHIEDMKIIHQSRNQQEIGTIIKQKDGSYFAKANLLQPSDTITRNFLGRYIKLTDIHLEQTFSQTVDINHIRPHDFSVYRYIVRRSSWTKKHPLKINLTELSEILVLDRKRITKEEFKQIKLDTDWINLTHSKKGEQDIDDINLTIPTNIKELMGRDLILLPYK